MILDTISQIAHDYPYFTLSVVLYLFAEIYPEKYPFSKIVKTVFFWLSFLAILIQFNLIDVLKSLVAKFSTILSP